MLLVREILSSLALLDICQNIVLLPYAEQYQLIHSLCYPTYCRSIIDFHAPFEYDYYSDTGLYEGLRKSFNKKEATWKYSDMCHEDLFFDRAEVLHKLCGLLEIQEEDLQCLYADVGKLFNYSLL